jgi:hypothetical protein
MAGVMGFCQLALFAGFSMYLPELFPLRLRSTGISFCYNVGRYLAAFGPWTLGQLVEKLKAGSTAVSVEQLDRFREAATWMCSVYVIGIFALIFLPETKDHPLPEG